jgi:hypothetical protein
MFNLKYKKSRLYLGFWIFMAVEYYFLSLVMYMYGREPELNGWDFYLDLLLYVWALILYPLYFIGFSINFLIALTEDEEKDYEEGYSKKFDPIKRAAALIKRQTYLNKDDELYQEAQQELLGLEKKYEDLVSIPALREKQDIIDKEWRDDFDRMETRWHEEAHGDIAPKVRCPYCEKVGQVRRTEKKQSEETREKGFVGAVIGKTTITERMVTAFFCDNCQTPWSN